MKQMIFFKTFLLFTLVLIGAANANTGNSFSDKNAYLLESSNNYYRIVTITHKIDSENVCVKGYGSMFSCETVPVTKLHKIKSGKATNQVITNKIENKSYAARELYQTEDNFLILSRGQEYDWKSKKDSESTNLDYVEVYTPAQARNIEIIEELLRHSLIGQKAKIAGKVLEIQHVYANGLIIGFSSDELQGVKYHVGSINDLELIK